MILNLMIYWCPECECSFEQDSDEDEQGICPECGTEGEFMEEVEGLAAA